MRFEWDGEKAYSTILWPRPSEILIIPTTKVVLSPSATRPEIGSSSSAMLSEAPQPG